MLAGSGCTAISGECDGAGDADGLGVLAPVCGLGVLAEDVLAAGDWTRTEATPLEQPAATAASKQPPSRTLLRLPTANPRSIHEVDIPAAIDLLSQHSPSSPAERAGGQALLAIHLGGLLAFYRASNPVPVVAAGLDADDNQDDN